ncbi:hypothetical protein [Cryobacterium sp. N22]|uniref:hypothetical protein n=1 Tax=Cryobacterium sp. N22 TaxID=2048290 RepID=UPI000CE4A89A|nr:hypothetical protein [Cryobacterium sp. N22]
MDASSPPSDAERELDELRRRAYGPHPDIQADPAAMARLTELEAARTASPPDGADAEIGEPAAAGDDAPAADPAGTASGADASDSAASGEGSSRSLWQRLTASRARRGALLASVLVAFLALAYTVAGLVGPHPDATVHRIPDEPDGVVLSMLGFLGTEPELTSIRGYEPYRGFEPWFAVDAQGFQCFMIIDRSSGTFDGANCVPPGVDLFADIGAWPLFGDDFMRGLPNGSIIRFHYRGDSVDVFLYPSSEAD